MQSIDDLINKQNNTVSTTSETIKPDDQTEAQSVLDYSNETVASLLKQSIDIHWQQAMELTGQGVHLNRWGYRKLGDLFLSYGKEELEHASIAIDRLEFFDIDYQPISVTPRVWQRHDVKSIIEFNLEGVNAAANIERAAIAAARLSGDEMTSQIIIPLLKGSDDGIAEFERMLKLIEQMGIDNFLTLQV
jgi:bacterioferritin (cytochrome b1)